MPELSKLTPEQLRAVRTRLAVTACCSWAFFLGVLYVLAAWLFAGSGGGGSGGGGDGGHHHSGGGAFWSLARRGGYGAADALAAYTFEQDVGGSGLEAGWASPLALRPAAVVFIAHGCSHSARDVFVAGADLPEEAAWARAALARRLAVVAVSSGDREGSRCWRASDAPPVARALAEVARRERWVGLPLFAVGASSGGAFVSTAPAWLPPAGGGPSAFPLRLRGLGVQISSVPSVEKTITASYPPVAFVHMPRDERTAGEVDVAVERLERLGVPVASFAAMPKAVTAAFLAARMRSRAGGRTGEDARGGASAAAQRVAEALAAAGMVDADGFLLQDPRASRWREALRSAGAAPPSAADGLAADASPLSEALNVAWAAHEFTAEHADEVLAFWLRHLPEVEYRAWREGSHRAG